jgi:mannose/cellobiose epimerase-like protein (N-acyl-D-glucosamine 2-epimerase family)
MHAEEAAKEPPEEPDFLSADFLQQHIRDTLQFYFPRCIDPRGGFYHFYRDDGSVYDADTRHLVSSTRFVFVFAKAYRQFGDSAYLDATRHGVAYLRDVHRQANGGYAWLLKNGAAVDATQHAYGAAFVLLAYAHAVMADVDEARPWLGETWDLLERHYWLPDDGLYLDERSADWSQASPYRGQNANMHLCEAMLAAYEATLEKRYLDRAELLASNITQRQAQRCGGLIWEHYREDWSPDWDYNRDDPANLFRPWGFQPGHLTEWAKLLLILERHRPLPWLLPRARELFDAALTRAWDNDNGGICYGFAPDDTICDADKYHWVQAESFAAAAMLAQRSGDERYWDWYQRIWSYAWRHFVDHQYGAWFRILDPQNRKLTDEKSPAGKADYHNMGACYDVLSLVDRRTV